MIEKNGMLTDQSCSDFTHTKKAEFIDEDGFKVASAEEKHLLKNPKPIVFEADQKSKE